MDSQNRCNVICSLWFNLNVSHCIGSIRNYFRFLQPTPASPGCRPGCLAAEYNFFKVLEGVLETEWSNSNRGIEEERVEEEIEKWEEEEEGSWTRCIQMTGFHSPQRLSPPSPHLQWCCPVRSSNSFKEPGRRGESSGPNPQRDSLPLLLREHHGLRDTSAICLVHAAHPPHPPPPPRVRRRNRGGGGGGEKWCDSIICSRSDKL